MKYNIIYNSNIKLFLNVRQSSVSNLVINIYFLFLINYNTYFLSRGVFYYIICIAQHFLLFHYLL